MSEKTVSAVPTEVDIGTLTYVHEPIELVEVKAHTKEGKFGKYQDGYTVLVKVISTGALLSIVAKKGSDWFNQLSAVRVLNPHVKKFSFTEDTEHEGRVIVNGVLN